MKRSSFLLLAFALAGCVEPAGTAAVPADPAMALQQQQLAIQQQRLDLQRQALDQQRARDEAAQRAADQAAADADYDRIQALMRSGAPGVPEVRPVSIDDAPAISP